MRYNRLFILCDLWPSLVVYSFCQGHLHFIHKMYFMLLNVCTKKEVFWFNRVWNMNICIEKTLMTLQWRHHTFDFYETYIQIHKGHIKAAYWNSVWSSIRELRSTVGKLSENYEEKMGIESLWPWRLTQDHQFQ